MDTAVVLPHRSIPSVITIKMIQVQVSIFLLHIYY